MPIPVNDGRYFLFTDYFEYTYSDDLALLKNKQKNLWENGKYHSTIFRNTEGNKAKAEKWADMQWKKNREWYSS